MHLPVLLITTPNGELHPIAFHSQTFSVPKINYDVHAKELLMIFEAFDGDITSKSLHSQSMRSPIRICNIFQQPKSLMHQQACWSESLSSSNL